MKLTESTLRRIIREELAEARQTPAGRQRSELMNKIVDRLSRMRDTRVRQELLQVGWESFADHLQYIERHHQLLGEPVPQKGFNRSEVKDKLARQAEEYMRLMGKEEFARELLRALPMDQVRGFADSLGIEYGPQQYEKPIGKSMR